MGCQVRLTVHLRAMPNSKYLQRECVEEAYRLLAAWEPLPPFEALQLLDAKYASPVVRKYAVDRIQNLGDRECRDFLLQLTQVLTSRKGMMWAVPLQGFFVYNRY